MLAVACFFAQAARLAVAQKLNVKLLVDDNNVTIAGHPSEYLPVCDCGWDIRKGLRHLQNTSKSLAS